MFLRQRLLGPPTAPWDHCNRSRGTGRWGEIIISAEAFDYIFHIQAGKKCACGVRKNILSEIRGDCQLPSANTRWRQWTLIGGRIAGCWGGMDRVLERAADTGRESHPTASVRVGGEAEGSGRARPGTGMWGMRVLHGDGVPPLGPSLGCMNEIGVSRPGVAAGSGGCMRGTPPIGRGIGAVCPTRRPRAWRCPSWPGPPRGPSPPGSLWPRPMSGGRGGLGSGMAGFARGGADGCDGLGVAGGGAVRGLSGGHATGGFRASGEGSRAEGRTFWDSRLDSPPLCRR